MKSHNPRMVQCLMLIGAILLVALPSIAETPSPNRLENPKSERTKRKVSKAPEFKAGEGSLVTLSGRVHTVDGRPISRALVMLIDLDGATRFVRTGSFGYFTFNNITPGRTYVVGVFHSRFIFASPTQTIEINTDLPNFNLVGEENW